MDFQYYIPKYFKAWELIPEELYNKLFHDLELWKVWLLFDPRELITLDKFREIFGPTYINTWHKDLCDVFPEIYNYSGFRTAGCEVGAEYGQHKFGRATDKKTTDITPTEAQNYILKHPEKFPYIMRMEKRRGWTHTDCGNWNRDLFGIQIIETQGQ